MGTLGQKLDYLTDTKSILKQKINNLGGSLTDESTFRSYGNYLDELYNEMPKVTGEGTEITLTPTRKGRMQLDLKGNTYQDSTTGKNLFNKNGQLILGARLASNGAAYSTDASDYYISEWIRIQPNITYTKNSPIVDAYHRVCFYTNDNSDTFISYSENNTFTTPATSVYLRFCGLKTEIDTTQIEENSTATDFEPYTGGVPSPNPDYPQPIHVVTGENSIGVQGKNLFDDITTQEVVANDGNIFSNSAWNLSEPIAVFSNETYTFSRFDGNGQSLMVVEYDDNLNFIKRNVQGAQQTNIPYTITTSTTTRYVRLNYNNTYDASIFLFEQGSTATDYVPYYHADYPINLGSIELCKIGDYQDYLYKENGNWYLHKETHKHTLTGVENWGMGYSEGLFNCGYESFMPTKKAYSPIAYSNYFVFDNREYGMSSLEDNKFAIQGNYTGLFFRNNSITSASDFKTWLGTHNTNIYYILAEATNEEIIDETLIAQLDAIENAMSTTGTTTITQTNADLPFIINASALKPFTTETLLTSLTDDE